MPKILNETLETIEKRKSTRAFADTPITPEEKETILHAAFRAPTAGNMMLYTILEIEDQAIKDHLAVTCDNQPFIAKAPYVLLFLADYQRWMDVYTLSGVKERCTELGLRYREPQAGDFLLAVTDAVIAAQNAVIAAESLGIGSCYIGDITENYEDNRRLFSLPRYVFPAALLCFGRPNREHTPETQVSRFAPEFISHKKYLSPPGCGRVGAHDANPSGQISHRTLPGRRSEPWPAPIFSANSTPIFLLK